MNTVDKYKTYGPSPVFLNIQTEKDTYYIFISYAECRFVGRMR